MDLNKENVEQILKDQLNDALESINADHSFRVVCTDMKKKTFTVEFDIVIVEEDNYIGLSGY